MLGIDARAFRIAWTLFLFCLFLAIVYYIRATIVVFAGAVFFAYMLSPIVALVERFLPRRRTLALGIVYVLLLGALTGIGFAIIPTIASEATDLVTHLPAQLSKGHLATFPLPGWLAPMREQIISLANRAASSLEASVVPFIQQEGTRLLTGLGYLLPIILVPILAFFFLKDAREIRCGIIESVEMSAHRLTIERILDDVHNVLTKYIRALLLLAVGSFVAWVLFLTILRYPYQLLLAGIAGLLEFIPVFGPLAALGIILIVAAVTGTGGLIWILVFWGCFRLFQDYIFNPYLMSSGVEIHPLLVLFGVLAGDRIAGIPGMFFSIPVIAILKVVYLRLRAPARPKQFSNVSID